MPERSMTSLKRYRALEPTLQAYTLGLLSTTSPQILSFLVSALRGSLTFREAIARTHSVVRRQLGLEQFPAACAILVGGTTLLPRLFWLVWTSISKRASDHKRQINGTSIDAVVKFTAAFIAAITSFTILNSRNSRELSYIQASVVSETPFTEDETNHILFLERKAKRRSSSVAFGAQGAIHRTPPPPPSGLAGRTLNLTFFTTIRALDIAVTWVWQHYKTCRLRSNHPMRNHVLIEKLAAPSIFALSSSMIMWSWFYSPDRLPRTYNTWIASAAQIDARLIELLRQARYGNFVYGKDTGLAPLLESMCRDLGFPTVWGDPAKTVPVPCELVHSGTGPSCEWHAITRFARSWRFAMSMYLPLNLVMLLRRKPSKRSTSRAFLEASQSSAFLGAFTALFYYGVCCARTRVGPKLFSSKTVTPMMWDSGLCVGAGCLACGWSILLEKASRRQEIAFFVAPRAVATLFPRRYERRHIWREELAFALSAAVILTTAQLHPEKIRGVLGRLSAQLFQEFMA